MELRNNEDTSRYELHIGGELVGFIDYRLSGDVLDLPHTQVDPAHGGQGHGARLAKFALDEARAQGKQVHPTCPFIADYLDKHTEYQDLLAK